MTAVNPGTLVIGAGQAGVQVAASLRGFGYSDSITLVGQENALPYQRPPLSKAYMLGNTSRESLLLRKQEFFDNKKIDVVTGVSIVDIAMNSDGPGGVASTDAGTNIPFADLALTLGSIPRRLPLAGESASNVYYMRTVDDADRLGAGVADAETVVVIGGGFIGLEAASVLRALGKRVTVVEAQPNLLARVAGPVLGDFYVDAHRRRGVDVRLGYGVERFDLDSLGRVASVSLVGGERLPCDVVVVGIGVERDRTLAKCLDLEWDRGIVVDSAARTSRPNVVAAGDCTVGPHPLSSCSIRLESVQNAVDQAKIAAATICGLPASYTSVPWFWSDQGSIKLQMAGLLEGFDSTVVRGDPGDTDAESFSVLYLRAGRVVAVESVNRPLDFMAVRKALTKSATFVDDVAALSDCTVPLSDALS
ncbi:FAD-dependent oxidoreductase [Rhodococcus fascians]|nr:FAD-dependent oxidoreductase [Rhodococcus fascians]MBY4237836.1 FAD-dependent oxidoreductase [Rhodococcus fascians]MBY4253413.1 FAD-dependent oxidoreductase [Rhodococcus fascians]MBY4269050.1 FAD-dependent oxidoreductase [Rhodococcus fascians]MBY4275103.1 FAD-dependent oxidoreductase [Rhodococcus fascians]